MKTYNSRFPELGFYVAGELRKFHGGCYVTEDSEEIAVLDVLTDAILNEETPEEDAEKTAPKGRSRKPTSAD